MKTSSRLNPRLWLVTAGLAAMLMLSPQTSHANSATWNPNPESGYWEDPLNWTPYGFPNDPSDVATFNASTTTDVFNDGSPALAGIVFNGNTFTISSGSGGGIIFVGYGIANNSGNVQNFLVGLGVNVTSGGYITFLNGATAGINTAFTASSGPGTGAGNIGFNGTSTADHGTFTMNGGAVSGDSGGSLSFGESSTADHGTFIANGGVSGDYTTGGGIGFTDTSTAAFGIFTVNGGTGGDPSGRGGSLTFIGSSTAGNATLIANGGTSGGGSILFAVDSTGGTARVELFGNGNLVLEHNAPGVTIGSIEGTGNVFLGVVSLDGSQHLTVGSNDDDTTFSGHIDDSGFHGSFTKIGNGILTFQGRATNDYIAATVSLNLLSGSIINLNYTGAPDIIASLTVDGVVQPPGVYGSATSGAPHQLPEFAGLGTVQVTMGPTPTPTPTPTQSPTPTPMPHPAFFAGETALGGGWYYLQFANGTPFGYYSYLADQNFIYHIDLGYEYLFDANDANHGIFFYDFASTSFFYTSPSAFPYLYDFSLNAWLYYLPDVNNPGRYTHNPRWFFNFATGQWITL